MRRRRWIVAGLLLLGGLLVGLLALLLKDFVRESILVPLAYTVSGARVVLNLLPQVVWWVAFLLVGLFILVGAVLAALPAPRHSDAPDETGRGRVETWMRWIDLAAGDGDRYARQDPSAEFTLSEAEGLRAGPSALLTTGLARRVRDMTLGALATRDALTRAEVESRLLKLPPGAEPQSDILLEFDIERIVRYLEDEMEIPRGG